MTDDKDPVLQSLFAEADTELADDSFAIDVMQRIDRERRIRRLFLIAVGLLVFVGLGLLALPLQSGAIALSGALSLPLMPMGDSVSALILSPINSVAGAVGLALLALRIAYKALFP